MQIMRILRLILKRYVSMNEEGTALTKPPFLSWLGVASPLVRVSGLGVKGHYV